HHLWTPAYIGTTGNKLADEAAKAATLLPAPPTHQEREKNDTDTGNLGQTATPVSLTTSKRRINADVLDRWKALWAVAKTGRPPRTPRNRRHPTLPNFLRSPYISSALRAAISILAQLRTDFSALNAHRFRCRLAPNTNPFPPALPRMGASTSAAPAQFIQGRPS
ncbi:hypothetical protein DFH09DRAFT_1169819, partial [Mycena vulgaris]